MNIPNSELLDHLQEQLLFIDSSCKYYDAGARHECKRLATHVRVLLHDTGASTSLLTHLQMKDRVRFAEGVPKEIVEAASNPHGAVAFPGLAMVQMTAASVQLVPTFMVTGLGDVTTCFDSWWTEPRMFDPLGNKASRRQIVLWLANKDGGAHIDKLPPTYKALSRDGSMGMTFRPGGGETSDTPTPIPAAMRQIAEEVRTSIRRTIASGGDE